MSNIVLYIVTSPMQLINAFEYKKTFGKKNEMHWIVIFYLLKERKAVFDKCLSFMDWDKITFSYRFKVYPIGLSILLNYIFFRIIADLTIFKKSKNIKKIVFGHYLHVVQRYFVNKLSKETILVDDGNFSFQLYSIREAELNGKQINTRSIDFPSKVGAWLFNKDLKKNKITFFTSYPVKVHCGDILINNTYKYWQSTSKITSNTNQKKVFFLGSDYTEQHIISQRFYINLLQVIALENADCQLYYFAKYNEDKDKLKEIENYYNIMKLDLPFELFLLHEIIKPKKIIGVVSSILFNVSPIFNDIITFEIIKVPENQIKDDFILYFRTIYNNAKYFPINFIEA